MDHLLGYDNVNTDDKVMVTLIWYELYELENNNYGT